MVHAFGEATLGIKLRSRVAQFSVRKRHRIEVVIDFNQMFETGPRKSGVVLFDRLAPSLNVLATSDSASKRMSE